MNVELERILEGIDFLLFELMLQSLSGGTEDKIKKNLIHDSRSPCRDSNGKHPEHYFRTLFLGKTKRSVLALSYAARNGDMLESGSRAVASRMRSLNTRAPPPLLSSDDEDRDSYNVVSQCVCRDLISKGIVEFSDII